MTQTLAVVGPLPKVRADYLPLLLPVMLALVACCRSSARPRPG